MTTDGTITDALLETLVRRVHEDALAIQEDHHELLGMPRPVAEYALLPPCHYLCKFHNRKRDN